MSEQTEQARRSTEGEQPIDPIVQYILLRKVDFVKM